MVVVGLDLMMWILLLVLVIFSLEMFDFEIRLIRVLSLCRFILVLSDVVVVEKGRCWCLFRCWFLMI